MTITLHCGLPKTGSTFLQRNVFPRATGGQYVSGKYPFSHIVAEMAFGDGPRLFSDETVCWTPLEVRDFKSRKRERMLAYLADLWPQSNLLLFLREPSEMIRSHYAQYLHDGGPLPFSEFLKRHVHKDALRYEKLLDAIDAMPWRTVRLFDARDLRQHPEMVIAAIEDLSGMKFPGWKQNHRSESENVAVTGFGATLLRWVNAYYLKRYSLDGYVLPPRVLRRRRRVRRWIQQGALRFLNKLGSPLVEPGELSELRDEYAASWRQVSGRLEGFQVSHDECPPIR